MSKMRIALLLLMMPVIASGASYFDYEGFIDRADTLVVAKLIPKYRKEFSLGPQFDNDQGQTLIVTGLHVVYVEKEKGKVERRTESSYPYYWKVVVEKSLFETNIEADFQLWVLDHAWAFVGEEATPVAKDYSKYQEIMERWKDLENLNIEQEGSGNPDKPDSRP